MAKYEIYKKQTNGKRGELVSKYNKFTAVLRFNEVVQQGCGGINLQRRPDHDDGVGGFDQTNGFFYQRHGFAEPDDVRPQRSVSAVAVGQGLVALPRQDFVFINRASEQIGRAHV